MEQIELKCDLSATLLDSMGTQLTIVNAARVSLDKNSAAMTESDRGLLRYLMKNRHASPFEHCVVQFLVEAPIFVAREWHRHRTQSYNEMSGRYTELKPVFYAPDYDRPLVQVGKPGAYRFEKAQDIKTNLQLLSDMRHSCQTAWDTYQRQMAAGVAKEVARMVLPVTIYTKWYATANLRSWLNFISLETDEQALYEIRQLAGQVETNLHRLYPDVLNNWDEAGRGRL